jgi:lysyl-tRNA synthetase, class II
METASHLPETIDTSDLFAVRLAKLDALKAKQEDPFSQNWTPSHSAVQVQRAFSETEEPESEEPKTEEPLATYSVAGRIVVYRDMGKSSFIKLLDQSGKLQLYIKKDVVGDSSYEAFKNLDIGDIIGAKGSLFKTKTGEITLRVTAWKLLAKALRPLPEKWHGLVDNEQVYRQRYLDLISNDSSRERFFLRSKIIQAIRQFLWDRDFFEVETPIFQNMAGGAAARPFQTHMNALDCDFYLRISLELYLKRMLIGGWDKVFEIGRVFRNEGLSRKHNPEFTMLELYQAYSDYRGMMRLTQDMIQYICKTVLGTSQIERPDGTVIDLGGSWREVSFTDLVLEATQDPLWFSQSKADKLKKCEALGIEVNPNCEDFEVSKYVFEKLVEPTLIQPTFVTHLPKEMCPLAKVNPHNPKVLDVFELCINGQEIAPAYSEQNDPIAQRQMFEAQAGEDIHAIDQDFLFAMEHAMPPAGGLGIGIDRLVILLTGASNIRDTILFPTLKPIAS